MNNYKNILVPYDFREQADIALSQSYNLARLLGLDITLLYVYEESGLFSKLFSNDQNDEMIKKIENELTVQAAAKSAESGLSISSMIAKGKIYSKITEVAELIKAKFIILGTASSSDPGKNIIGANTSRVIRNASCPVITIGARHHYNGCRSILVPIDLTQESRQKVKWAVEFARMFNATVKVVSVLWSVNHKEIAGTLRASVNQVVNFIEEKNIKCTAEIIDANKESEEVPAILQYAADQGDIDLIMIMTQKETGLIPFFVDSQATEIIRTSSIPVMSIVPQDMGEMLAR